MTLHVTDAVHVPEFHIQNYTINIKQQNLNFAIATLLFIINR